MTGPNRVGPRAISRALQRDVNRLFEDVLEPESERSTKSSGEQGWRPPADVAETDDAFLIEVDLPGVEKEDVEITLQDRTLTVEGRRDRAGDAPGTFSRMERPTGRFGRSFRLGEQTDTDNITARHENGVLVVHVPKSRNQQRTTIAIE